MEVSGFQNSVRLLIIGMFVNILLIYRLPPGTSLFDTMPSRMTPLSPRTYCTCPAEPLLTPSRARSQPVPSSDSSGFTCSSHGHMHLLSIIPTLDVTAEYIGLGEAGDGDGNEALRHKSRRQTHRSVSSFPHQSLAQSDLEGLSYFFPEDHEPAVQPFTSPTWPTPSGLTERQGRSRCQQAVANSSIAAGCRRMLEESILDRAVSMCVTDLQLKDEQLWLNATLALLENECERRLVEEPRREEVHQDALAALRCPGLCNGNGQCSGWGCVCFPGFGSYDCSSLSGNMLHTPASILDGLMWFAIRTVFLGNCLCLSALFVVVKIRSRRLLIWRKAACVTSDRATAPLFRSTVKASRTLTSSSVSLSKKRYFTLLFLFLLSAA